MAKQQPVKSAVEPESPKEMYLVSKVNRKLVIPKGKRCFPNKETLEFTFKAGIRLKVPAYVAKAYSESYPHVYSIVSNEAAEAVNAKTPIVPQASRESVSFPKGQLPAAEAAELPVFNAVEFLNNNHPLTKDKLLSLSDKDVFLVAGTLALNPDPNTPKMKLIEQVFTEVEVRNK
jgi:hypothetical protein